MTILHVISGLGQGGAEGCLARLVLADREDAHVVVSLMDEGTHGPELRVRGVEVHSLNLARGRMSFRAFNQLVNIIRTVRPDVVQTWMCHADLVGGAAARLARVPRVVWGIRNSLMDRRKAPLSTTLVAKISAWISPFVPDAIVSCSDNASREHAMLGYNAAKMVLIPNGIDLEKFRSRPGERERLRHDWGVAEEAFLLGMVARYDAQKDHENLLRALARFEGATSINWKCALVGRGLDSENTEVVRSIHQLGLTSRVILCGPRDDIPSVMNAFDCHVLSSSYGEGFPNVLAEAMACGVPCVATKVGDAEVIVGHTGWSVHPNDPEALADALFDSAAAFSGQDWRDRQVLTRHRIREHFSLQKMVSNYRAVWGGQTHLVRQHI